MSNAQKNLIIARSVVDQGLTVARVVTKFGVSRQWVHQLVQRYRSGGVAAVLPQSKVQNPDSQTTTEADRFGLGSLDCDTTWWLTVRMPDQKPSPDTWRGKDFSAIGLHDPTHPAGHWAGDPTTQETPQILLPAAPSRTLPNGCRQAYITYWFLAEGTRVEILDFLDDHSRLLLTIQAKALWTTSFYTHR